MQVSIHGMDTLSELSDTSRGNRGETNFHIRSRPRVNALTDLARNKKLLWDAMDTDTRANVMKEIAGNGRYGFGGGEIPSAKQYIAHRVQER